MEGEVIVSGDPSMVGLLYGHTYIFLYTVRGDASADGGTWLRASAVAHGFAPRRTEGPW